MTINPNVFRLYDIRGIAGQEFSEEEIVDRMMLPMIFETARCVEEQIVATPNEADMGLILGIGFPPFRGGALKYADTVGLKNLVEKAEKYATLGKLYAAPERLAAMAADGETFYRR